MPTASPRAWPRPRRCSRSSSRDGLLAAIAQLPACIPIPISPHTVEGRYVAEEAHEQIALGTPRAAIEARIGPPAIVWEEGRIAVYGWRQETVLFVSIGASRAFGPFRYLLFEYNDDDRLTRTYTSGMFDAGPPDGEDLIDWWLEGQEGL